jgi:hypothetical protein
MGLDLQGHKNSECRAYIAAPNPRPVGIVAQWLEEARSSLRTRS